MEMNEKTYDVEIDIKDLLKDGYLDDYFFLQDLKARHLILSAEVDQCAIEPIVHHIFRFNAEDAGKPIEERKPIILYISSPGGEVDSGFELIDVIECSETPVYTVNMGYEYSMAFLIGIAGKKRYAFKNAKFLMHDGSGLVADSSSKIQDRADFLKRMESRVKEYVVSHTKISSREYNAKQRVEWYMFTDEAKEKGVIDYIVGKDCGLNDIM